MRRLLVKEFDANKPVIARKAFKANGRQYSPGDKFEWRNMAIAQRRVRQMYEAGYLHHGSERPPSQTIRELKMTENAERRDKDISKNLAQKETLEKSSDIVSEKEPVDDKGEFPKHAGGPWYELSNGDRIRGREAAEQAQSLL